MRFHHIGVASRRIGRDRERYRQLGYRTETDVIEDPGIGVAVQFLVHDSAPRVELVAPLAGSDASPVQSWLKAGHHVYHQGFATPNFDDALEQMTQAGQRLVSGPMPAVAFDGNRVAFYTFTRGHVIELIEENTP